ncbi:MAG: hypothetical protein K6F68_00570 [Clostridiales bacterium]|nr:hypothetical protein [Clostridiales bacterium]
MKLIKSLGFFLITVILFIGIVFPFSAVPKRFEDKAREVTLERVENGSLAVKDNYIEDTVRSAVLSNINNTFKTAFCVSVAVAVIIYCLTLRAPHDCGGVNWFNPIGIIFTVGATLLLGVVLGLLIKHFGARPEVAGFMDIVNSYTKDLTFADDRIFFVFIVPAAIEIVFRMIMFSYLEKIHFSAALVLDTFLNGAAVYIMFASYEKWAGLTSNAAVCAAIAAMIVAFVECVITWQLRSGIPAVGSHILLVYGAGYIGRIVNSGSFTLPVAIGALVGLLALMIVLFSVLGRKFSVFSCDFPFTKHHKKMREWMDSSRPLFKKKSGGSGKKANA